MSDGKCARPARRGDGGKLQVDRQAGEPDDYLPTLGATASPRIALHYRRMAFCQQASTPRTPPTSPRVSPTLPKLAFLERAP